MGAILDGSVVLEWCLGEARFGDAERMLRSSAGDSWVVPSRWPFEVANGLRTATRRGLPDDILAEAVSLVLSLPISPEPVGMPQCPNLIPLARLYHLTVYDAAYLQMALDRKLPLATLDDELRAAAHRAGVLLVG